MTVMQITLINYQNIVNEQMYDYTVIKHPCLDYSKGRGNKFAASHHPAVQVLRIIEICQD